MKRRKLLAILILTTLLIGGGCQTSTTHKTSSRTCENRSNAQIIKKTQGIYDEKECNEDTQQGNDDHPPDDLISSTMQIPGDTIHFIATIPYDEIAWSTLEVTAGVIEFIADDGFLIGFLVGYHCGH